MAKKTTPTELPIALYAIAPSAGRFVWFAWWTHRPTLSAPPNSPDALGSADTERAAVEAALAALRVGRGVGGGVRLGSEYVDGVERDERGEPVRTGRARARQRAAARGACAIALNLVGDGYFWAVWTSASPTRRKFVRADGSGLAKSAAAARRFAEAYGQTHGFRDLVPRAWDLAIAEQLAQHGLDPYSETPPNVPLERPAGAQFGDVAWRAWQSRLAFERVKTIRAERTRDREAKARWRRDLEEFDRRQREREAAEREAEREKWRRDFDESVRRAEEAARRVYEEAARHARPSVTFFVAPDLSPLGLSWPTTLEAVKAAFRRKALENHPDRGGSHEAMVAVNQARDAALRAFERGAA